MKTSTNKVFNIAIDGPSAAGKTTLAKALAIKLDFIYLDTGSLYRALAYHILQEEKMYEEIINSYENGDEWSQKIEKLILDQIEQDRLAKILNTMNLKIEYKDGQQKLFLKDVEISPFIRHEIIAKAASDYSALPLVREHLLAMQRQKASEASCILDGRDIGSFVLPKADLKLFLDAAHETRANRRYLEILQREGVADYQKIANSMKIRDENDRKRKISPLIQAEDAILIDSTNLSAAEVLNETIRLYEEKRSSL